mgnify:CR=1 FL=1
MLYAWLYLYVHNKLYVVFNDYYHLPSENNVHTFFISFDESRVLNSILAYFSHGLICPDTLVNDYNIKILWN